VTDGSFGNWRGRAVEIAGTWDNSLDGQTGLWSITGNGGFANWANPIDEAVGAIFLDNGESWSAAAKGAYNDRWTTCLTNMNKARQGKGTTFIRFAHEFNLSGSNWRVTSADLDDFKTAWKIFYGLKQSLFKEAQLVWCPNDGTGTDIDIRDAYPGSDVVDVIGVDSYNNWPAAGTADAFQNKIDSTGSNGEPLGIETWRQFALSNNRPMAVPEWSGSAVSNRDMNTEDAVDYPAYMDGFYAWLKANGGTGPGQVWYEIIFDIGGKDYSDGTAPTPAGKYELWPDTNQPNAAKRYAELW
jgi:hypothetical protein